MPRPFSVLFAIAAAGLLAACGKSEQGAIEIGIVGTTEELFAKGVRLSIGGQMMRAATVEGLVGLDADGEVIPALAERWIVTDDGRSYIFRLREGTWPDGRELTADSARTALLGTFRQLRGTALGLDLDKVDEVRAMAGRVVEVRLTSPMPEFLQLLAQPELGLFSNGRGFGRMTLSREGDVARLTLMPPEARGLPADPGWRKRARRLNVRALPAEQAINLFNEGKIDAVLGGQVAHLPFAQAGPLLRGTIRLDRAIGLFGLRVVRSQGFLAEASNREAVAMAVDRTALVKPFNINGWEPSTRLVAPGLAGDLGTIGERWSALTMEERQSEAARRAAMWRRTKGRQGVTLKMAMPDGPGYDVVFGQLEKDLAAAGITALRVSPGDPADLAVFERVARYAAPRWFLNQFNCSLRAGACSPEADARVSEALQTPDSAARAALLAEAEAELTAANVFIPFGPPLRWSLVRGDITGFEPNRWGFHPLPPLALTPK